MNFKKSIILLTSILCIHLNAQTYEFGQVSKDELLETVNPIDSAAGAAVLYLHKEVYYESHLGGVELITEVHKRIKFYNDGPEDLHYATQEINLYKNRDKEEVKKIKAYTYNLEGDKIVEVELDKKQIFTNEVNENYEQVTFTLPQIKKGSVIEISYKIVSPFIWNIDEFEFQFKIPAKKVRAKISTPEGFNFNRIPKGFLTPHVESSQKLDHRLGMSVNIFNYDVENVPALKEEKFVDNIDNYKSGILFELISVKLPQGQFRSYSRSWEDVARTIASTEDYEKEINRSGNFEGDIDVLIANEYDDHFNKMVKIFNYTKNNIKWNKKTGKYFDLGLRKAYKEKTGNVADINLTLVSMLRYAGFQASPIVISTRDNLKPFFPTVDRLNYVIAYVKLNDEEYFLDATDKFSEPNILPIRDYNWNGVFVDTPNKTWKLVSLKQPPSSQLRRLLNVELKEDGSASGTVQESSNNHYAYLFRKLYNSQSEEDFLRGKESKFNNIEINNYLVENVDIDGEVKQSFKYNHEFASEIIGDKIFVNPLFFYGEDENPFKAEERNYPVDFGYPFKDKTVVNIKIPEGYEITSLPQSILLNLADRLGKFEYLIKSNGSFIRLSVNFEVKKSSISADQYKSLKEFFNQMIQKQTEQIELTKV